MKKIISILIAVIMTATLLCAAVPAFAAEADVILYCNGEDFGELSWQEAYDLVKSDALGTKGVTSNYKIKLLKNIELTSTFNPTVNVNIEIDGLLANGQKATINSTVTGNNWRLEGGGKYVFRNVNLVGQPSDGCLIQLNHVQKGGDLDIIDSTITSTNDCYYTINAMAKSGVKQTFNIIRSTITQNSPTAGAMISTGNSNDHYMHLEINVIDSTLKSNAKIVNVNSGSTGEVNLVNSILEVANPTANGDCALRFKAVENLKGVEGMPTTNVINATNSLIKIASGTIVAEEAGASLTNNYQVGEPNTEVTSPLDNIVTGLPEIVTTAPTTTAPDEEADDETTTTAAEEEEDDVTTTVADEEEDEEDDETTPADEEDDGTTAAPDNTTEAPVTDAPAAAEGGCAGCAAGDGATAAIALVVAMAAAVAIVVKRK